jgi:histidyl-tRNA synthetase
MQLAQDIRATGLSCSVDITERKIGKKITTAANANVIYIITIGEDEVTTGSYTMKHLESGKDATGTLDELMESLIEVAK